MGVDDRCVWISDPRLTRAALVAGPRIAGLAGGVAGAGAESAWLQGIAWQDLPAVAWDCGKPSN
jgi:hypothetical protein